MNDVEILLNKYLKDDWKDYSTLHGGMMNRSYLVNGKNKQQYILYIPGNDSVKVDREVEKYCQDELAKSGLTSKNVFFDVIKGIKMNEFIPGTSLDKLNEFDYEKVAVLLHGIHDSKLSTGKNYHPFNRLLNEYEPAAREYVKEFDKEFYELKDVLISNRDFLESQSTTLSHNDFQRSNIVSSIDNKYYVIDFEFAADNDPIYDISAFGNGSVLEGRVLLSHYFRGRENKEEIKRYYLWRIFISLQWYLVAINKHYKGEGEIHKMNFLDVAKHFLNNAIEAKEYLNKETK